MSMVASQRRRRTAARTRFRPVPLQPCSDDWLALDRRLPPDHPARAIARAVSRLDLTPLMRLDAGFGSPAYPPPPLLAAVLFEIQRGHHAPAQWHRHAQESDPLRWLWRGLVPGRACWYRFRDRIGPGLLALVQQAVADAAYAGGADLAAAAALGTTGYAPWQANDFSAKKKGKYYPKEAFRWLPREQAYECPQGQRLSYRGSSRQKRSGTDPVELQQYRGEPETCACCAARGQCTPGQGPRTISRSEHEGHIEALRERMQTAAGKQVYRLRKQTVERANADRKAHRGLRRLSGHGRRRADAQVGLTVLAYDWVTLEGLRRQPEPAVAATTPGPRDS